MRCDTDERSPRVVRQKFFIIFSAWILFTFFRLKAMNLCENLHAYFLPRQERFTQQREYKLENHFSIFFSLHTCAPR